MKRLLSFLFLIAALNCPAQIVNTVTFNWQNSISGNLAGYKMSLTPRAIGTNGAAMVALDTISSLETDTNGQIIVTNLVPGGYAGMFKTARSESPFTFVVPTTNGNFNLQQLLTTTLPIPGTINAYSMTASDARFTRVPATNTTTGYVLTAGTNGVYYYAAASGGTLAGDVTGSAGANAVTHLGAISGANLTSITGANVIGTVPLATTATSFTGSLAGNVTGTQGATVVSSIGSAAVPAAQITGTVASSNGGLGYANNNLIPAGQHYDDGAEFGQPAFNLAVTVGQPYFILVPANGNDDGWNDDNFEGSEMTGLFTPTISPIQIYGFTPNSLIGSQLYKVQTNIIAGKFAGNLYGTLSGDGSDLVNVSVQATNVLGQFRGMTNHPVGFVPGVAAISGTAGTHNMNFGSSVAVKLGWDIATKSDNAQYRITGITDSTHVVVDQVPYGGPLVNTYTSTTNYWLFHNAVDNNDIDGNPGSSVSDDGGINIVGNQSLAHNSGGLMFMNGSNTFHFYVGDAGNGGAFLSIGSLTNNSQMQLSGGAPNSSFQILANGVVVAPSGFSTVSNVTAKTLTVQPSATNAMQFTTSGMVVSNALGSLTVSNGNVTATGSALVLGSQYTVGSNTVAGGLFLTNKAAINFDVNNYATQSPFSITNGALGEIWITYNGVKVSTFTSNGATLRNSSGSTTVDSANRQLASGTWTVTAGNLALTAGGFNPNIISTATNYTTAATDSTIKVTATGQTITLPAANAGSGSGNAIANHIYTIKLTASGSCTIATTSSQLIDGATTYSLSAQYKYVTVQSDGTQWWIIANN